MLDPAPVAAEVLEAHARRDVQPGQAVARDLGPLDERDAVGRELVVEQLGLLVAEALREAVEVEVRDRDAAVLVAPRRS